MSYKPKVKKVTALQVGNRRYTTAKAAAQEIALFMASRVGDRIKQKTSRTSPPYNKLYDKAYRRIYNILSKKDFLR